MKKFILGFILFISMFLSSSVLNATFTGESKAYFLEEVTEVRREYILKEDQWFLYIYYSDGTIGVYPCEMPPEY